MAVGSRQRYGCARHSRVRIHRTHVELMRQGRYNSKNTSLMVYQVCLFSLVLRVHIRQLVAVVTANCSNPQTAFLALCRFPASVHSTLSATEVTETTTGERLACPRPQTDPHAP